VKLAAAFLVASVALAQRTTVLDNEYVRVLDVTETSTTEGRPHEHATNRVMVYLTAGRQQLRYADGRREVLDFRPGTALWSAAGGVHTSQNTGGAPFRVIEVELKKAPGRAVVPALDPVRVAPRMYKVVHDQPQARVLRVTVPAGASVPLHEHTPNRVVIFLTDGHLQVTGDSGERTELRATAGEVRWSGAARHREQNLAAETFEVVAIELK
jgi:quercetin dioxygenase-like cupin family protein